MEDAKQREDHPSQARTDSPPCPCPVEYRDQGPKGSIETKTVSTSMLRAMEGAWKASDQIPWLHASVTEAIEA